MVEKEFVMKNTINRKHYPWKSFTVFLGIYLISLVLHYPAVLEQARLFLELFGENSQYTPVQFSLISMLQPLLLGVIVIYVGHRFVEPVQLRSVLTDKIENRTPVNTFTIKDSIPFVVSSAVLIALLNLGFDVVFQNWLPDLFQPEFSVPTIAQSLSSIFFAGLAQEILLRWGVMTAIIYVLSTKGTKLNDMHYFIGLIFTAILYAFSQYSNIFNTMDLSFVLLLRVLLLSGLPGILYGWLYKKFHFEAAVMSHMLANSLIIVGYIIIVELSAI